MVLFFDDAAIQLNSKGLSSKAKLCQKNSQGHIVFYVSFFAIHKDLHRHLPLHRHLL